MQDKQKRPLSFYILAALYGLFVIFLYGPMSTIFLLSLQGPEGQVTFPMRGFSLHWFNDLFTGQQKIGDFGGAFSRSLTLGLTVMLLSATISIMGSLALRRRFVGSRWLFYLTISSLVVPSILVSFGIGVMFNMLDWQTGLFTSALGAQLTWTLPFTFLVMIVIFNRFNPSYEEAARDLGANDVVVFWRIILPLIGSSLIAVFLMGFTLSYDEFARTASIVGEKNTLPVDIFGMTTLDTSPSVYALGTVTTIFSLGLILLALAAYRYLSRNQT